MAQTLLSQLGAAPVMLSLLYLVSYTSSPYDGTCVLVDEGFLPYHVSTCSRMLPSCFAGDRSGRERTIAWSTLVKEYGQGCHLLVLRIKNR